MTSKSHGPRPDLFVNIMTTADWSSALCAAGRWALSSLKLKLGVPQYNERPDPHRQVETTAYWRMAPVGRSQLVGSIRGRHAGGSLRVHWLHAFPGAGQRPGTTINLQ